MKSFIVHLIVFVALVLAADFAYGYICDYMVERSPLSNTGRNKVVFKNNRYDVMIMGSSRCVCHYNDKMMSDSLGLNVINVGEKGNGIILMYGKYHIIPKRNKPKVLIYDVEPNFDIEAYEADDNNHRYLAGLKPFFREDGIYDLFKKVDRTEPLKMNSSLYRYNSDLFGIVRDFIRPGSITYSSYKPTDKPYVDLKNTPKDRDIDFVKAFYFEQLIEETRKDGVQLIVVASPKFGATTKFGLQPIEELCKKYSIPFWDYYYDMHDTKWFCDNSHLNYDGSLIFTQIIINRFADERILIDNN